MLFQSILLAKRKCFCHDAILPRCHDRRYSENPFVDRHEAMGILLGNKQGLFWGEITQPMELTSEN